MDVDDRTKAIMERAKQRKAELDCEEGKENLKFSHEESTDIIKSAKASSTSKNAPMKTSPVKLKDTDQINEVGDVSKNRRSVFAELAEEYDDFSQQSPPKNRTVTKENYTKGRSPRLSIGETRPSVLCTPAGFAAVSRSPSKQAASIDPQFVSKDSSSPSKNAAKSNRADSEEKRLRFAHPISATSTYYEESSRSSPSLNESTIVAGNLVDTTLQSINNTSTVKSHTEVDDESECGAHLFIRKKTPTKTPSSSSIQVRSPQPFIRGGSSSSFSRVQFNPSATSSPKMEDTSIIIEKAVKDDSIVVIEEPINTRDESIVYQRTNKSVELIKENTKDMSPVRSAAIENATAKNIAHMLEERIRGSPCNLVPIPKASMYTLAPKELTTPIIKTQWRGATNTPIVTGTTPGEPARTDVRIANLKDLRNRWEFSSITGTPLHPDESEDALVQAAIKMRETAIPSRVGQKIHKKEKCDNRSETSSPTAKSPRHAFARNESFSSLASSEKSTHSTTSCKSPEKFIEDEVLTEDMLEDADEKSNAEIEENTTNISRFIDDAFDFMGGSPSKTPSRPAPLATPEATPAVVKQSTPTNLSRKLSEESQNSVNYCDTDSKKVAGLQYTISYYRKRAREEQAPNPNAEKIDLTNCFSPPVPQIIGGTAFLQPMVSVEEMKKKLQEKIFAQKTKVHQASKALQLCRQKEQFRGSHEEATAQWAVLIETEIQRAAENEYNRLCSQGLISSDGPQGSMTLSYISVELNRDFVDTYANIRSRNLFYFCIILRSGDKVLHTTIVSSEDAVKKSAVEIVYPLTLKFLPSNFTGSLDIYSLCTIRTQFTHEEKFGLKGSTIKNKTLSRQVTNSPAPVESSFQLVGRLALDIHVPDGKKRFLLSDVRHPLEGHITIKLKKVPMGKSTTTHSGFLSMYQRTKEGLGTWNRYWCVLEEGGMKFWRRPEDAINEKSWLVLLDLQTCAGEKEGASEVDDPCQYLHSFNIDVWVPKEGQDTASLSRNGRPDMEKLRVMLAADTKEEMRSWLEDINITVKQLLTWNRPFTFNK